MVLEKIIKMVEEQFMVEAGTVTEATAFVDDLSADSLDVVELTMALEEEFELPDTPEEELTGIVTVGDLACMDLVDQFIDAVLLIYIEFTLVDTVCDHLVAQLAAAHVVQDQPLFAGVDHRAVVQSGELFRQLRFLSECGQLFQDGIIYGAGAVVEVQTRAHGNGIAFDALSTVLAGHSGRKVYLFCGHQGLVGSQSVHVVPTDHWVTSKLYS